MSGDHLQPRLQGVVHLDLPLEGEDLDTPGAEREGRVDYDTNDTNTHVYSPVSRQRVLRVQLHLAVLVHLRLVLRHRLHKIKEVYKGNRCN